MKILEKILIITYIIGLLLKIFFIPGAIALIFISIYTLKIFYLLFSFFLINDINFRQIFKSKSYEKTNFLRNVFSIFCNLSFFMFIHGLSLIIFNLPFKMNIMYLGSLMLCITLIINLYKYFQINSIFYKNILIRTGVLIMLYFLYLLIYSFIGW
jgi:hypothetical protein